MNIGKRFKLSIVLIIIMTMIMAFPIVANADEGYSEWTSKTSLPTSGKYKLTDDVTIAGQVTIGSWASSKPEEPTKTLILDLNGHSITSTDRNAFYIQANGGLTIEDSAGGGRVTAGDGSVIHCQGSFTLNGGTIDNTKGQNAVFVNSNGDATVNGGRVVNSRDSILGHALAANGDSKVAMTGGSVENLGNNGYAVYVNTNSAFDMSGGTVKTESSSSSNAAIYSNGREGTSSVTVSGGAIQSKGVGIYSEASEIVVTGGTIETESYAFQTRYATIDPAEGSEVTVKSKKALFFTFSGSDNQIGGGTFEVERIEEAYTDDEPSVTTVDSGNFNVNPASYVTDPESGVVSDGGNNFAAGTESELNEAVERMIKNGARQIAVEKGSVALDIEADGIAVTNKGGGEVTVNGQNVTDRPMETHTHLAVKTEAKAPTCTADGNIRYWYCAGCGKYFSDEALSDEIKKDATVVKSQGHKYENGKCVLCGDIKAEGQTEDKEEDKEEIKTPETGDGENPVAVLALLFASAGAIAVLRKKTVK